MTRVKNKSFKWMVIISLIVSITALSLGVVGFAANRDVDDVQEVGRSEWTLGNVSDTGKLIESEKNLVTNGFYSTEFMDIALDENDATITYRVIFYDENKDFVSSTETLEENFDKTTIPENAAYFRVVITPYEVDGEAVKISSWFTKKYTSQITVNY